ncbi:MAG TPA: glycosyltransferase family 2 protein [Patescibacteria group bacterium]|nr:glycosyltransferase family 2 protein [Patescibacteria group bacterium]
MKKPLKKITIVIPALNEEKGIGPVINDIPIQALKNVGYEVEILVVDNGSTDKTPIVARKKGATVIIQPIRGYGNAYKAGFANATGDIIATGDADLTYPFAVLPKAVFKMQTEGIDFINTNRLKNLNPKAMSISHRFGNYFLTTVTKVLFDLPFEDSQSGMWIFRKTIWKKLRVKSSGMPFSQELKIEAFIRGYACAEIPITYRARAGKEKLNTLRDGIGNLSHLIKKRITTIF